MTVIRAVDVNVRAADATSAAAATELSTTDPFEPFIVVDGVPPPEPSSDQPVATMERPFIVVGATPVPEPVLVGGVFGTPVYDKEESVPANDPFPAALPERPEEPPPPPPPPPPDESQEDAAMIREAAAHIETERLQEVVSQMTPRGHDLIRAHLDEYLARNGAAGAFDGWLHELLPENVEVPASLREKGGFHWRAWETATSAAGAAARRHAEQPACALDDFFAGMAAMTAMTFGAMHMALGGGIAGLDKAATGGAQAGAQPCRPMLKLAKTSLELADICTSGAEMFATRGLACAGATAGLMR